MKRLRVLVDVVFATIVKRTIIALIVFASMSVLGAVPNAQARHDHECSEASLNGSYGFMLNGTIFGRGLVGGIGVITFDGNGNLSFHGTVAFEDTGLAHPNSTGTYTVSPDCTGSSNFEGGAAGTFDFVILDAGGEILQIATGSADPTRQDRVVTWVIKKQGLEGCTEASLNGSYGVISHATNVVSGLAATVGVFTFDGRGHWTLDVTEVGQGTGVRHITNPNGTYTVNPDCTGSSELPTPMGPGTFDFVIVDGGKEILQIATTDDPIRVVTHVVKKQFHRHHDDKQD